MQVWLRVVLSLVIPIAWGLGSAWLLDSLAKVWRKRHNTAKQVDPPQ
ncbi:MAG: hypothetical protein ACYC6L_08285 [Anaerolineae bacterium]